MCKHYSGHFHQAAEIGAISEQCFPRKFIDTFSAWCGVSLYKYYHCSSQFPSPAGCVQ